MKAGITGGEVSDYKGYDADHIRENVTRRGGTPVMPGRSNRKTPIPVDGFIYALRNQIERGISKLKCARRFATRYDKTASSYLGFIHIVAVRLWFRSLSTCLNRDARILTGKKKIQTDTLPHVLTSFINMVINIFINI